MWNTAAVAVILMFIITPLTAVGSLEDLEIALEPRSIDVAGTRRVDREDSAWTREASEIVDMALGLVIGQMTIQPDDLVDGDELRQLALDLGQSLEPILEAAKTIIDALSRDKFLLSGPSKYLVDRRPRNPVEF